MSQVEAFSLLLRFCGGKSVTKRNRGIAAGQRLAGRYAFGSKSVTRPAAALFWIVVRAGAGVVGSSVRDPAVGSVPSLEMRSVRVCAG